MSKYKVGDYIRYTEENIHQIINKLKAEGEVLYSKGAWDTWRIIYKDVEEDWVYCHPIYRGLKNDITESFLLSPQTQTLPEKWYLDCGDKMEVREWLDSLGYTWNTGHSLTNFLESEKGLRSYGNTIVYWSTVEEEDSIQHEGYTKITPTISTKPVDYVSGFTIEPSINKELEALEAAYKELGVRLKALRG
jgi:hypothetical protein